MAENLQYSSPMKDAAIYLSQEHVNHRALFQRILDGDYDAFTELRSALVRHVRLEEEFLFSKVLNEPELEEAVRVAWEEHNVIMELLQKIDQKDAGSISWLAKVRALEKLHNAHVDGEESIVLPLLETFFSDEELALLEKKMKEARKDQDPDEILYPEVPGKHQID
jgi:hemerythrin-like domain-containing protein